MKWFSETPQWRKAAGEGTVGSAGGVKGCWWMYHHSHGPFTGKNGGLAYLLFRTHLSGLHNVFHPLESPLCKLSLYSSSPEVCVTLWTVALCDPVDCSSPGSSLHGVLQARILEWVAIPSARDLPNPGSEPTSLTSSILAGRFLNTSTTWEVLEYP